MFAFLGAAAAIAIEEERNVRSRYVKQVLRDYSNPFLQNEEYFRQHYRLTPYLAMELIYRLSNHVDRQRNSAIPFHLQVLSVLRLLAEGAFQKGASSDFNHPMCQGSMSCILNRVLDSILALQDEYIHFPGTREERQRISNSFQRSIRVPGVIGLVDCLLVACIRPTENEEAFYNYKVGSSLNVQVVTDANYIILNICICPGSNTDRFIWSVSDVKDYLQSLRNDADIVAQEGRYYFLGDSGYTPSPILLTPILDAPENTPEAIYTNEHVSTRCKVEQTFGVLTNTWMVIKRARKLYYRPEKIVKIITACAILHNFRRLNGMQDEIDQPVHNLEYNGDQNMDYLAGIAERNTLIIRHYAR